MNKMHSFSSLLIANYFLEIAREQGKTITPMQLNKLVYIANGFFAGNTGNPLISDRIEAWQYGPVIPNLYHKYKNYGGNPISQETDDSNLPEEIKKFLNAVYGIYGKYSGIALSQLTHQLNTPWDCVYDGTYNKEIPHDLIEQYYRDLLGN